MENHFGINFQEQNGNWASSCHFDREIKFWAPGARSGDMEKPQQQQPQIKFLFAQKKKAPTAVDFNNLAPAKIPKPPQNSQNFYAIQRKNQPEKQKEQLERRMDQYSIAQTNLSMLDQGNLLSPPQGVAGQHVSIDLRYLPDLGLSSGKSCKLSFGTLAVDTVCTRTSALIQNGHFAEFEICVAIVPPFSHTNWFDATVPVQALIVDGDDIISMVHVGMFHYVDIDVHTNSSSAVSTAQNTSFSQPQSNNYHNLHQEQQHSSSNQYHSQPYQQSSRDVSRTSSTPHTRSSTSDLVVAPVTHLSLTQNQNSSIAGITPPLSPLPDELSFSFVQDDFDNILAAPWTPQEVHAGRRIVLIEPTRHENTTVCRCRPVDEGDGMSRERGDILISCIYWPSENQFIITGVDIIYAMEQLLLVEYNTDKKNRVRRNLEKFDPRTVSKSNPNYYEFFWKIMAYGDPKPRNIEANVKVYPWVMLTEALQRILEKFGPGGSFKARSISGSNIFRDSGSRRASTSSSIY